MTSNTTTLNTSLRDGTGKGVARKLRAAGQVPAVLYGTGGDPVNLSVDAHDAELLFQSISVASTVVDLEIPGQKVATQTLVREVQVHPYKPELIHIDFMRIQAGVAVEVDVPLHLDGTPEGVRSEGGNLEQIEHEIPVRCLPSQIPEAIHVDVTGMGVGDSLHVYDLPVDDGIEILFDPDRTLANVSAQRAEEVVPEEDEDDFEITEDGDEATEDDTENEES